ncbi:hypothetical protein RAS1_42950 [Phycisphaerae bacterium RAS1]|nr:hypothetical protein RAS1_42950 [Phycisphaerae bacterium RAS1]
MSGTAERAWKKPAGGLLVAVSLLTAAASGAGPSGLSFYDSFADYGDAPDGTSALYPVPFQAVVGNFPTLRNTTNSRYGLQGGHCLTTSQEWLGLVVSRELDADDTSDPDLIENLVDDDFDDSLVNGPCAVGSPPAPFPSPMSVTLGIRVNVAAGAPNVTRYINILIDHNHNGVWANVTPGAPEWVVVDMPVSVAPGTSAVITTPAFALPLSPIGAWTRIVLTRTPVAGTFTDDGTGWDGSGRFNFGEVEDFLMANALAYAQDAAYAAQSASDFAFDAQYAYDWATDFDIDVDLDYDYAFDIDLELEAVDMDAYSFDIDVDYDLAFDYAQASQTAHDTAQQYAYDVDSDCAAVATLSASMAAVCVSCPCATACAHAGAVAAALAAACASASANAHSQANASASSHSFAVAQASAIAVALAQAEAHASAFAAAFAIAEAEAAAIALAVAEASSAAAAAAVAYADADAAAAAAATASAAAYAAACGGDAVAAATASAQANAWAAAAADATAIAHAEADAAASALAVAAAAARAIAFAYADASAAASASATTVAVAHAHANASAHAYASATANATAAAHAKATSSALVAALTAAYAAASASCSGDCCPVITGSGKGNHKYKGTTATTSVRAVAFASSWTMVHMQVLPSSTEPIQGFQWLSVEDSPGAFPGVGDWAIWDLPTVQGGMANDFNAMMSQQFAPAQRQPLMTDCGTSVQLFGRQVFRNTIQIPPQTLPPGDYYVGTRLFSNEPQNSFVPVSHRDENAPSQPSYFQGEQFGYPTAVPIANVIGCDENVAIEAMAHAGNSPGSPVISEKELEQLMQLADQLEKRGVAGTRVKITGGSSPRAAIGNVP